MVVVFVIVYLSIDRSIYLSVCLHVCLSVCLPASLKTQQFFVKNETIPRDFLNSWTWQHQKRSNSARPPQFSKLTTSKTKQFCETCFKNGKLSAELTAWYQCVLRFFHSTCLKHWACHEKVKPGHTKCCTCHLKIWCSKMQPLSGNQRPDLLTALMNISCTAPATENASLQFFADPLQMSHACHRFWKCYKILTFCSLLTRCPIPCACHAKRRFNVQKWREHVALCTFWLRNVLRATTAYNFWTSQLPKVLWTRQFFTLLISKCASRHNGVQVFISHLASWLRTRCFSEPTFRPSGATNHWKNTVFRDFPTFSRTWIFFLLRLSLFWSSFFFSSLLWLFPSLLFICPYCRKFDF